MSDLKKAFESDNREIAEIFFEKHPDAFAEAFAKASKQELTTA